MATAATWFRIHSCTGILAGLLLFVVCWSGTFAVISHELDWLVQPAMRVTPGEERASWGTIVAAAQQVDPAATVSWMQAPQHGRDVARVHLEQPDEDMIVVLVDPYTATVQGQTSPFGVQRFFRSFHMSFFDVGGIGSYLVMAFALVLALAIIAALCFYPRWWTLFRLRPHGDGRAWWSSLHKALGVWSLWFLLVITLTGVWYLVELIRGDWGDGIYNYVGGPEYGLVQVPEPQSDPALPRLPLDDLLDRAEAAWPELAIDTIGYGWFSSAEDNLYVQGQAGFPLVRGRANQMHLDPRTGEILWRNAAGDLPAYWIWSNMADPLHFGDFAGLWSKALWFLFGLAMCALILTGTWLHAERLAGRNGRRHRWPGTTVAIGISVLILGATVPYGLEQARDYYGSTIDGVKSLPDLAPGTLAVIAGWIVLTLGIIAWWIWALLWRPRRTKDHAVAHGTPAGESSAPTS